MDMRKLVGRNAARLRKAAGLTQEQLAERSGFSQHISATWSGAGATRLW
jgi:transcriptional regulator with XRE-family HTH domain